MLPKFISILYYLLPFSVFGQAALMPNNSTVGTARFGRLYYLENSMDTLVYPQFPVRKANFPIPDVPARQDQERFGQNDDYLPWPLDQKEVFRQPVYRESLSLSSMIRPDANKLGVSSAGGLVYIGSDDVFAYAHYGRTGKLIWRTSPIANNMMATRWSLANFDIFRRTSSSPFQVN